MLTANHAAAATCASINVANSNKESIDGGTGSSTTTTGIVAVVCDDGYSGSANAVCTADYGAETATFAAFTACAGWLRDHLFSIVPMYWCWRLRVAASALSRKPRDFRRSRLLLDSLNSTHACRIQMYIWFSVVLCIVVPGPCPGPLSIMYLSWL